MTAPETMWTGTTGCNTYIDGQLGTTTGFTRTNGRISGAFVKLDDGPMLHVTLFETHERDHAEVGSSMTITREQFDNLNGIAEIRKTLGWRDKS